MHHHSNLSVTAGKSLILLCHKPAKRKGEQNIFLKAPERWQQKGYADQLSSDRRPAFSFCLLYWVHQSEGGQTHDE